MALKKIVEYRLYCLDNISPQVGGEGTQVDVHLRSIRNVLSNFVPFDGSRPITLTEFFKFIRIQFHKAYGSEGMALLIFGGLVGKKASRLYSSCDSSDVVMSHPTGTMCWAGLVRAYSQTSITDSVEAEGENCRTLPQIIRARPERYSVRQTELSNAMAV